MIGRFRKRVRKNLDQWVEKRLPQQNAITLNQSRIFIVPTRQGLILLIIAVLVLLLAINFESALNYALAFWLMAMLWVAVHLTYRNLSGLTLTAQSGTLVEVGDVSEVSLKLSSQQARPRGVLECIHPMWGAIPVDLHDHEQVVTLPVPAEQRGPVLPPRFRIESRYPFGLIVAWSYVSIDVKGWAFPKAVQQDRQAISVTGDEEESTLDDHFFKAGSEDFHGLRSYQPGDPIRRLHWPGFSRDQLLVKSFTDYQATDESIDWAQFPGLSTEDRLAAIAWYCQTFFELGRPFGVTLPNAEIPVGKGEDHLKRVRRQLAEFGYD